MTAIATNPTLLKRLSAAAKKTLSEEEIRAQKVSFILSSIDDDSTITKDQVEKVLDKQDGIK